MPKPKEKRDPGFAEYLEELRADIAKIEDADQRAAWEKVLENEEQVRQRFRGGLREADYYKRLNQLNDATKENSDWVAKWRADRAEVEKTFAQQTAELEALRAELQEREQALKAAGLEDDAKDVRSVREAARESAAIDALRKEIADLKTSRQVVEEGLRSVTAGTPAFIAEFTKAQREFVKDGFDFDESDILEKLVKAEGRLPIRMAFEEAVRDQRKERDEKELEKRLAAAKEEGRKEAMTQMVAPEVQARLGGIFNSAEKPADKMVAARADAMKLIANFGQAGA